MPVRVSEAENDTHSGGALGTEMMDALHLGTAKDLNIYSVGDLDCLKVLPHIGTPSGRIHEFNLRRLRELSLVFIPTPTHI
jgi:hypothetical protein